MKTVTRLTVLFLLTIIYGLPTVVYATVYRELEETLNKTFFEYDKNIRPSFGQRPVNVVVTAHVLSIYKVDTANQEFTIDFYFRQTWTDQNLMFDPKPSISNVTLESDYIRRVWVPDTFFVNEVTSSFHSTTVTNELIRLQANGDITKSMRLTVTATCPMELKQFPFDNPVCTLHMESFSSTTLDMRYEWGKAPSVTLGERAAIGDFTVAGYKLDAREIPALPPGEGSHSRLSLQIQLKRILGRYETDFYCPSFLLVLVTLSSLWIKSPKLSIGLASVNLIGLLALNLIQNVSLKLPKWAETNWLDSYTRLGSVFIVFVILVNLFELNLPGLGDDKALECNGAAKTDEAEEDYAELRTVASAALSTAEKLRTLSVSREDAKLVRPSVSVSPDPISNARGKVLVVKSKLHFILQQFLVYYKIAEPFMKWVLLAGFFLTHFTYWQSIPNFTPIPNLITV